MKRAALPSGVGWIALVLSLSVLALLVLHRSEEPSSLLEWWQPTFGQPTFSGPAQSEVGNDRQRRGRLSAAGHEPLVLKHGVEGDTLLAETDDETGKLLYHIKHKVAARVTQLDEDDDKFSEGELASRLGRAIDAHEKCRRHWPHLESLESAQEIRVHDARNNLEVANRGMERARKELVDAENLVMAARSEHQTYEKERVRFHQFKQRYNSRKSIVDMRKQSMQLYEQRESDEEAKLHDNKATLEQLKAQETRLELEQKQTVQLQARDQDRLKALQTVELAAKRSGGINFVKGQKLAQVPKPVAASQHTHLQAEPVLSQESDGIVFPSDAASGDSEAREAENKGASLQAQIDQLRAESKKLSREEVDAFATLPVDEQKLRELHQDMVKESKKGAIAATETLVAREQLMHDESKQADAKVITLDKDKLQLSQLNEAVDAARKRKAEGEAAQLEQREKEGPRISRALSSKREKLAALEALLNKKQTLQAAGVELEGGDDSGSMGTPAREVQLAQVSQLKHAQHAKNTLRSRAQLEADLKSKSNQLNEIKEELLKVQSKIRPQKERVAVDHEMLRSRTHELTRAQELVHAVESKSTQQLFSVYDEKLKALREERKKADGLLAKPPLTRVVPQAERMLNIARIDTQHAAASKKAALEELDYATHKLRKYQGLRAQSQKCQMEAWSTIRRLTHRARERKMLADTDERKVEALRQAHDHALQQELSQV